MVGGGGAWRSPQPRVAELEHAFRDLGVRSVICLRADSPGTGWYDREKAACGRLGLNLKCFGWSAWSVSPAQIDELIGFLAESPGAYLIHCRAGRDRTSLAAAIYRIVVLGHSKNAAASELSFFPHGHLPWFGYGAMDEALEDFDVEDGRRRYRSRRHEHQLGGHRGSVVDGM
ncbi:MAG: tyrosine-protein phosphatase [Planctomycetota bacterium]